MSTVDLEYIIHSAVPRRFRKLRTKYWKKQLKNNSFSIISSNCVGGVVAHDFGQQLRSPTVNLFFYPDDFIKFCRDLKHYMNCEVVEVKDSGLNYPVGKLDDIQIHFLHYDTFNQAVEKWNDRRERIHWDNIYIVMTDRDGCTEDHIRMFDELPYEHKIIFTSTPSTYKSAQYIRNFKGPYYNSFSNIFGRRYYDSFDFLRWFNEGKQ